jgi:adenylate cyclase
MRSIHEDTRRAGSPAAGTESPLASGMSHPPQNYLAALRDEVLEAVHAVIQVSEILLTETADLGQEQFVADLRAIHSAGRRLREMVDEFLDPDLFASLTDDALAALQKRIRHDMNNVLGAVLGYTEDWLEEAEEQFLQGFLPDLQRIHTHGKHCQTLLARLGTGSSQDLLGGGEEVISAACPLEADPLFDAHLCAEQVPAEPGYCLVVDDNEINRDILCRLLLKQGHRAATAVNGREALEKLQAESFDLVLLDIQMPEMNGFQVLRHLKSDATLRGVPVIMISGLDNDDAVVRCIAMGAEDYLPKPFNPLLLKARIGACLEKKRFRDKEVGYLRQIEQEKRRSDELLHVILPAEIVTELKATSEVRPRRYDGVAVLFADLVGFTRYCEKHTPEEVVPYLQKLVEAWENSALKYGVEKIKTIGDAFMAASGLLRPVNNPVLQCVQCGLEMIEATQSLPVNWDLRVGVHFGQVMAGVIGRRQYLFDLWGDTVNTAARMESHGKASHITLSPEAWDLLAPLADADSRLKGSPRQANVKSKGLMDLRDVAGGRALFGGGSGEQPS